jgi:hypothetical protein
MTPVIAWFGHILKYVATLRAAEIKQDVLGQVDFLLP